MTITPEQKDKYKVRRQIPCIGCGIPIRKDGHAGMVKTGFCRACYRGANHSSFRGGKSIDRKGYVLLLKSYQFEHPEYVTNKAGLIQEHVYLMAVKLGRKLHKDETVHHKNGKRDDNRIRNLELWSTNHPAGQRVSDLKKWAKEILKRYP